MRSILFSILILATGLPVLANHGRCEPRGEWRRVPERHSYYREDHQPEREWVGREHWRRERYQRRHQDDVIFAAPHPVLIAPPELPLPPVPRIQLWFGF